MKTKHITLKQNNSLIRFCNRYNESVESVINKVIGSLLKYEFLYDEKEDCGQNLKYLINNSDYSMDVFCVCTFGSCDSTMVNHLNGFMIWHKDNDCDECGCKIGLDEDLNEECTNKECELRIQIAPDPDQYRDDCHAELIKDFQLN